MKLKCSVCGETIYRDEPAIALGRNEYVHEECWGE